MILRLASGSLTPASLPKKRSLASTRITFAWSFANKHVHDQIAFVQAQQAMVYKNASQLVTNRAVNQSSRNRRINSARQTQDNFFVTHLLANQLPRLPPRGHVMTQSGRGAANIAAQNDSSMA
jgi:hypothetical protein